MTRGAAIAGGFLLDLAFGDPRRLHPVAGFGRLAHASERVLWRPSRVAGLAHALLHLGGLTVLATRLERTLSPRGRLLLTAAAVFTTTGGRSLRREASGLAAALERGDLDDARRRAPALVGRDPQALPADELARATVESLAENSCDAVVAPLLWAAVGGARAVVAYRAVNTLDAMVGHRNVRYLQFGWAPARLDDLANWPPARLTALLTAAVAPAVGGSVATTVKVITRDGGKHESPNAGRCEAAFAGALKVRLGAANDYGGQIEHRPFLGDGRRPTTADVARAVVLARFVAAAAAALAVASTARRPI